MSSQPSITIVPTPAVDRQAELVVGLGVAVQDDRAGGTPASSAVISSPPPATSMCRPSSAMTR